MKFDTFIWFSFSCWSGFFVVDFDSWFWFIFYLYFDMNLYLDFDPDSFIWILTLIFYHFWSEFWYKFRFGFWLSFWYKKFGWTFEYKFVWTLTSILIPCTNFHMNLDYEFNVIAQIWLKPWLFDNLVSLWKISNEGISPWLKL